MRDILLSGELWGNPAAFGGPARVRAYRGRLPDGGRGFEFFAFQEPDLNAPTVPWTPAGGQFVREEDEIAKLDILVTKVSQDVAW